MFNCLKKKLVLFFKSASHNILRVALFCLRGEIKLEGNVLNGAKDHLVEVSVKYSNKKFVLC